MSYLLSLIAPTHPLGILLVFPAVALAAYRYGGQRWLTWLTTAVILAIGLFPLIARLRDIPGSLAFFGFTLAFPTLIAALTVAFAERRHWTLPAVYFCAIASAALAWWIGLLFTLFVFHPVAGIAQMRAVGPISRT